MRRRDVTAALPPFLEASPPPWAARGLASILLSLFAVTATGAFVVGVPETVTADFVLVPVRGGDPVRALRSGVIRDVHIAEAQSVVKGQPIFAVASAAIADRAAEWQAVSAQIQSIEGRLASRRERDISQQRADEAMSRSVSERIESLGRTIALTRQRLATVREIARRQQLNFEAGLGSWIDASKANVDADNLALDLERAEADLATARHALQQLRDETGVRRAATRESEQGLLDELNRARIRKAALDRDGIHDGSQLVIKAPCTGTVLTVAVRQSGAVVQEGEVLAQVSCSGDRLHAALSLPQTGGAGVRPGQVVKLQYASFPYQRYGAQDATIRWISPVGDASGLRALADLDQDSIMADGQRRSLLPGMSGRARVIVGRRTLVSHAFEPIRQLRETVATQ